MGRMPVITSFLYPALGGVKVVVVTRGASVSCRESSSSVDAWPGHCKGKVGSDSGWCCQSDFEARGEPEMEAMDGKVDGLSRPSMPKRFIYCRHPGRLDLISRACFLYVRSRRQNTLRPLDL